MEAATNIVNFALTKGLPLAFESMIMPLNIKGRGVVMPQKNQKAILPDPFENSEAFAAQCTSVFGEAVKEAVEDNKRRGVVSWGTKDGKLGYFTPQGKFVQKDFSP